MSILDRGGSVGRPVRRWRAGLTAALVGAVQVTALVVGVAGPAAAVAPDMAADGRPGAQPDCATKPKESLSAVFVRPAAGPTKAEGEWWGYGSASTGSGGAEWSDELGMLTAMCVDQVVLQYTAETWTGTAPIAANPALTPERPAACVQQDAQGRSVRALYQSRVAAWDSSRLQWDDPATPAADCLPSSARRSDQVKRLLDAARAASTTQRPVKVWLGLQADEGAWHGNGGIGEGAAGQPGAWMQQQITLGKALIDDLWAQYGAGGALGDYSAQIAGFYLPFEGGSNELLTTDPPESWRHGFYRRFENLNAYLDQLSAYVKGKSAALQVMTSPYHVAKIGAATQPTSDYQSAVGALLAGSQVSVYAPQDATGAQLASASEIGPWMAAARAGITASGRGADTQLWANVEAYSMQGVVDQPIQLLVQHMHAAAAATMVDGYAAFSALNLNYKSWGQLLVGQLHYAAYRNYLALGWMPAQKVPQVGLPAAATLGDGTVSVTVQWKQPTTAPASDPAWDWKVPVIPVAGYQIYRDGAPVGQVSQPLKQGTDASRFYPVDDDPDGDGLNKGVMGFTDVNLQPGHSYTYTVAAFDAYGNPGPESDPIMVRIPIGAEQVFGAVGNSTTATSPGSGSGLETSLNATYAVTQTSNNLTDGHDPSQVLVDGTALTADAPVAVNGKFTEGVRLGKLADDVVGENNVADPAWYTQTPPAGSTLDLAVNYEPDPNALARTVQVHAIRGQWLNQAGAGADLPSPDKVVAQWWRKDTTIQPAGGTWVNIDATYTDPGTGTTTTGSGVAPQIADGKAGWWTFSLDAGQTVSTTMIRLHVVGEGKSLAIAELQALDGAGEVIPRCPDASGTNCAAGSVSMGTLSPDPNNGDTNNARPGFATGGLTQPGIAPVAPGAGFEGHGIGFCLIDSTPASSETTCTGTGRTTSFDVTVDLGSNQPLRRATSSWYHRPAWGVTAPTSVAFSYRTAATSTAPASGWVAMNATTSSIRGTDTATDNLTTYAATAGSGAAGSAPVLARWVRARVTLPSSGYDWAIAQHLATFTPAAYDLASNRTLTAYTSGDTTDPTYEPWKPQDPDSNNPTLWDPTRPTMTLSSAIACTGSTATECVAHSTSGLDTLTATSGGRPVTVKPAAPWDPDANLVALTGSGGMDLTVAPGYPSTATSTHVNAPAMTFLLNKSAGISLPSTVDLYYHSIWDNGVPRDDRTVSWIWSRATLQEPKLPPYLPDSTVLTYTYTFPEIDTGVGGPTVAKLRFHINTRGEAVYAARLNAVMWD